MRNAQVARLVIGRFRVQVPAPAVTNLQVNGSLASLGGARAAALLTALLTLRIRHRLRETFRHRGRSLANHLRIEPQRDRGIGVAEAGSNDMNRHARQQQSRRVQVSEVVQTRVDVRAGQSGAASAAERGQGRPSLPNRPARRDSGRGDDP